MAAADWGRALAMRLSGWDELRPLLEVGGGPASGAGARGRAGAAAPRICRRRRHRLAPGRLPAPHRRRGRSPTSLASPQRRQALRRRAPAPPRSPRASSPARHPRRSPAHPDRPPPAPPGAQGTMADPSPAPPSVRFAGGPDMARSGSGGYGLRRRGARGGMGAPRPPPPPDRRRPGPTAAHTRSLVAPTAAQPQVQVLQPRRSVHVWRGAGGAPRLRAAGRCLRCFDAHRPPPPPAHACPPGPTPPASSAAARRGRRGGERHGARGGGGGGVGGAAARRRRRRRRQPPVRLAAVPRLALLG